MTKIAAAALALIAAAAPHAQMGNEPLLLEALSLARTRESGALARFHRGYQITPADPRIATLEVITEYRRAVLLAQAEMDKGNFILSPTGLAALLAPYRGLTALRAEVRLSPLSTFVGPPLYRLELASGGRPLTVVEERRDPIYPPGAPPGTAMSGLYVEASFLADAVRAKGCCELAILDERSKPMMTQVVGVGDMK